MPPQEVLEQESTTPPPHHPATPPPRHPTTPPHHPTTPPPRQTPHHPTPAAPTHPPPPPHTPSASSLDPPRKTEERWGKRHGVPTDPNTWWTDVGMCQNRGYPQALSWDLVCMPYHAPSCPNGVSKAHILRPQILAVPFRMVVFLWLLFKPTLGGTLKTA